MKIKDFNFEPSYKGEDIQKGLEWLEKNYHSFHNRCNCLVINEEGDFIDKIGDSCHGFVEYEKIKRPSLIVNENATIRRWKDSVPKGAQEFRDWFVKDSHFSRFILASSDLGFVFSTDVPYTIVQNMNIISRHFWECSEAAFETFAELLNLGYSGDVAYGLCFNSTISRHHNTYGPAANSKEYPPFNFEQDQITPHGIQHRAWDLWSSFKSFRRFLEGDFADSYPNPDLFRNKQSIYGGAHLCGNEWTGGDFIADKIKSDEELKEKLREFRKASGGQTVKQIKNPFVRTVGTPPTSPLRVNYKELVEVFLPHLKEKGDLDVD